MFNYIDDMKRQQYIGFSIVLTTICGGVFQLKRDWKNEGNPDILNL